MAFILLRNDNLYVDILQCQMYSLFYNLFKCTRHSDECAYLKIMYLISQPKHMLWVLKRTV